MDKAAPGSEGMSHTDDFIKYHQKMWKELNSLEKIASELDEVRSVDIFEDWCTQVGAQNLPRPDELRALLESFKKGLLDHFRDETIFLQRMERSENLENLAKTFLGEHAKFTNELKSSEEQLKELLARKTGTAENMESWKVLVMGLKKLLKEILI